MGCFWPCCNRCLWKLDHTNGDVVWGRVDGVIEANVVRVDDGGNVFSISRTDNLTSGRGVSIKSFDENGIQLSKFKENRSTRFNFFPQLTDMDKSSSELFTYWPLNYPSNTSIRNFIERRSSNLAVQDDFNIASTPGTGRYILRVDNANGQFYVQEGVIRGFSHNAALLWQNTYTCQSFPDPDIQINFNPFICATSQAAGLWLFGVSDSYSLVRIAADGTKIADFNYHFDATMQAIRIAVAVMAANTSAMFVCDVSVDLRQLSVVRSTVDGVTVGRTFDISDIKTLPNTGNGPAPQFAPQIAANDNHVAICVSGNAAKVMLLNQSDLSTVWSRISPEDFDTSLPTTSKRKLTGFDIALDPDSNVLVAGGPIKDFWDS